MQNANDQAGVVAKAIVGLPVFYESVPWFWSNQYDLRLQTIGLSSGHDAAVMRGDVGARSFSIVYLKEDRVIALDCVNATKDYAYGRDLVKDRARISREMLSDQRISLKEIGKNSDLASAPTSSNFYRACDPSRGGEV